MQKLKGLMDEHQYHPAFIFNFDETMLHPGKRRLKVLVRAGCKRPIEKILKKGRHISFGLCVSAVGSYTQPLVIFPLKTLPPLPESVIKFFAISGQENGWINAEIYKEWVVHKFIPHVQALRDSDPYFSNARALLIIDGHSSRDNDALNALCALHGIDVIVLPAHSSATLQPLDLGVNGAFKTILGQCWKVVDNEDTETQHARLLAVSTQCLTTAMTPLYITEGFSKTGIFPFSVDAPLSSEMVIDPLDRINLSRPSRKRKSNGISSRILTDGIPHPKVYLYTENSTVPQIFAATLSQEYLLNPEEIMYLQ